MIEDEKLRQRAEREAYRQDEILAMTQQLRSHNPGLRAQAAARLGELRSESGPLLPALQDRDSRVRAAAAAALGSTTPGALEGVVIERLLAAIDDRDDHVCSAAVRSLGILRAVSAREEVLQLLDDPNVHVARAALLALGRLGLPEDGEEVASALRARSPLLRTAAARAAASLNYQPAIPDIIACLKEELGREHSAESLALQARPYMESLAALQAQESIPLLIDIALHHVGIRSIAIKALTDLRADEAVLALTPLLTDPSATLQSTLVHMLLRLNSYPLLPELRGLLQHKDKIIRQTALAVVTHWQDQTSADPIRHIAHHDPNPHLRPMAVNSLVTLLGAEALPDLLALAEDPNPRVREIVGEQLVRFAPSSVEADELLKRLAVDDATATAVQAAVEQQKLLASAAAGAVNEAVTPRSIRFKIPVLRPLLESWHATLLAEADGTSPEATEILDALSQLIGALGGEQSRGETSEP